MSATPALVSRKTLSARCRTASMPASRLARISRSSAATRTAPPRTWMPSLQSERVAMTRAAPAASRMLM